MSNYVQLQATLKEIFEIDKADLDFGIYRIMNQKRAQVMDFIDNRLPKEIKEILANTQSKDGVTLQVELDKIGRALDEAGVVRESSPKYLTLQQQIVNSIDTVALEQEVFSHLAGFFKRYYKEGDFISMRRYRKDVYAIPYEGEEVKLHWANHDQYYIKTSEYLKNYSFKLTDGKVIHFRLKEANTEQNNNKTQGDTERRFAVFTELPLELDNGELYINFSYESHKKTIKQADLAAEAVKIVQANLPGEFAAILDKAPTESNKTRTVLDKHLNDFISRNSFDYFIHKDLGGFLRRELDFYIKNEVLFVDDINTENPAFFTAQLSKIKAIKTVASKVIDFLAQIEDFQKKLWLKKKFVISTHYLITLDRVPEEYHKEVVSNEAQLTEWKALFSLEPDAVNLKEQPYLVLDTKFFSEEFKDRLLAEYDDLDIQTDGLLLNSENFQALNLLQEKYKEQVDYNYIDPPYNTDSAPILYKNDYKRSSWLSLLYDRMVFAKPLLALHGVKTVAIDDTEMAYLSILTSSCFENYRQSRITVIHNPKGSITKDFNRVHEYAIFLTPEASKKVIERTLTPNETPRKLRRWGENSKRIERPLSFYPIFINNGEIVGVGEVPESNYHPTKNVQIGDGRIAIYPIDQDGVERRWNFGLDSIEENLDRITAIESDGVYDLFVSHEQNVSKSVWTGGEFDAGNYGNTLLINILGKKLFDFPKSINLVKNCVALTTKSKGNSTVLDYFAGSGTTGHATIKLNREDGGKRKYILVEMGTYFNTVTKPRITKVIYSDNWQDGLPQDRKGISQMVKYQTLESYEDVLNNLMLEKKPATDLFMERAKEEYQLKYMLNVESREHLFDIGIFRNPFKYTLYTTQRNEQIRAVVDLVETFNYLIGLYVQRIQRIKDDKRDIKLVEGKTREGKKTLVIWRNLEVTTNAETQRIFRKIYDGIRTAEFHQIFINGDHHFENIRTGEEGFKIKLIEEVFFKKMFEG